MRRREGREGVRPPKYFVLEPPCNGSNSSNVYHRRAVRRRIRCLHDALFRRSSGAAFLPSTASAMESFEMPKYIAGHIFLERSTLILKISQVHP